MTDIEIGSDASFELWRGAPSPSAREEDWTAYKQRTYGDLIHLIRVIDRQLSAQPYLRLEQLRRLRREHHLVLVADRIRREAPAGSKLSLKELRSGAERVVDRGARLGATRTEETRPRSRADERMMISARVHWHKLLRKADSRAELRGMWGGKRRYSGVKTVVARIISQRRKKGAQQALREHVRDHLEKLVAVSTEVFAHDEVAPSRQDRLLVRELGLLLQRARTVAAQSSESRGAVSPRRSIRRRAASSRAKLNSAERPSLPADQTQGAAVDAGA